MENHRKKGRRQHVVWADKIKMWSFILDTVTFQHN